jgi:hypothetical protein
MRRIPRSPLVWIIAALAAAGAVLLLTAGDGEEPSRERAGEGVAQPPPGGAENRPRERRHAGDDADEPRRAVRRAIAASEVEPLDPAERPLANQVRAYVRAVSARDGERICSLFVPRALAGVDFPRDRGSCAASLDASIGYADPRGFPVYDRSRIGRIGSGQIDGSEGRVVATIVTHFADDREPSVEDDLIYMEERGGGWLIAKPSALIYRAIGAPDVPPQALTPP